MSELAEEPRPDDRPLTLAETVQELANQPVGPGRLARRRKQALGLAERLTSRGALAPVAEIGWNMNRRLQRVGGMALPALIAYRAFAWLLPLAVASVFAVGLFREDPVDARRATDRYGLAGYVAGSISQGTAETGRPGILTVAAIGGIVLLYQTYALIRGMRAVHALIWQTRINRLQAPAGALLVGLGGLLALIFGRATLDAAGEALGGLAGALVVISSDLVALALYVVAARWLPNRAERWSDLVPGAILFTVALTAIHAVVVLVLFPYLEQKAAAYGSLGLAAGILLALLGVGWAVTLAAALNAELVDRRRAARLQQVGT